LTSEVDYIKTVVGAGYVILGPITKGFYTNSYNMLGLVEDYEQLDEAVGTMDDFRLSSTWLENCPNSQLYRNGSVKFVEGVREEMNKWIKESGKENMYCLHNCWEKCPSVPKLPFWKSTVGYWLDVFAFKDSSGDLVGDLNGLTSEVDYIKTVVGAGYVILGPITKGFYTNSYNMLGLVEDYEQLDEAVGTMDDFRVLLKRFHKNGIKVVLTFNFNAISISHKWITENKVKLNSFENSLNNKMSRYGKAINVDIGDQKFYSVFGSPNVDLDLTSSETQKAIFNVIQFWMKEGIDGILLDNAAFFVEEKEEGEEGTQSNLSSTWLENCPNSQLYRNGSVKFVEGVREEMNKWIKESGKEKLLAVNSGDTGCGVGDNPDPMLMFRDVADLIISRELVFNRGRSEMRVSFDKTTIEKYSTYSDPDKEKLGLIASTSNNPTDSDVIQLALTLLLPGQPIIYYGTETGINNMELSLIPEKLYPKGKRYNNEVGFWSTRSHLPMPWDFKGRRFSATINDSSFSDYLDGYSHKETVE
ncbi:solute carrier family 3 (neutral and basic amino acid transporter), member 1, partial [Schistosoma bovis]